MKGTKKLTFVQSIHAASQRQLIRANHTCKDRQETASQPPPDWISEEVDLLAGIVLRPEANTTQEERPLEGFTRVRVLTGEGIVMEEHGAL